MQLSEKQQVELAEALEKDLSNPKDLDGVITVVLDKLRNFTNSYEESVKEFHELFNHPVEELPTLSTDKVRKLRFKLILEELVEYAIASNISTFAVDVLLHSALECKNSDKKEANINEIADALEDLQYVVSGTKLAHGMQDTGIFYEVHDSNISKAYKTEEEANAHATEHNKNVVNVDFKCAVRESATGHYYLVRNDGKVVKAKTYKPVKIQLDAQH